MPIVHVNPLCKHTSSPLSHVQWHMMRGQYAEAQTTALQLRRSTRPITDADRAFLHFAIVRCRRINGELSDTELLDAAHDVAYRAVVCEQFDMAADARAWAIEFCAKDYNPDLAEALAEGFFADGIPHEPGYRATRELALARVVAYRQGVEASLRYFDRIVASLANVDPPAPCVRECAVRYLASGLYHVGRGGNAQRVLWQVGINPTTVKPELPHFKLQ